MTTQENKVSAQEVACPAEKLLKSLSGKWKPQLFRLATEQPLRINTLLRQLSGSTKQSLAVALKEMEQDGLLDKKTIKIKPLHIEYHLTDLAKSLVPIFMQLEKID